MMSSTTEIIMEIAKICGEKKMNFILLREGEKNYIKYTPKDTLIINAPDVSDEGFVGLLEDELKVLQDFGE